MDDSQGMSGAYTHMFCGVGCSNEEYTKLSSSFSGWASDEFDQQDIKKALAVIRNGNKLLEPVVANSVEATPEYTGGSVGYYSIEVTHPTTEGRPPYIAECNDIIEALKLNYAEGNVIKAIWRRAAAEIGKCKEGYKDGLYDAEKVEFFGHRLVVQESK